MLSAAVMAELVSDVARPVLRRHTVDKYATLKGSAHVRPYMIEALAAWWASVVVLTTGAVTSLAAAFLAEPSWARWTTGVLAALWIAAGVEAMVADPFQYEPNCSTQRLLNLRRRHTDQPPPDNVRLTPSLALGVTTALVAAVLAIWS